MRALSDELDGLSVEELERHDPSYIQGVRVLYDAAGTPQRDETAFRHALKTAHRAHKRGQRLKDNLIIDAYEHAYRIAHAQDTLGRPDEMPPMRDRLTMARRVRAYATTNKTTKEARTGLSSTHDGRNRGGVWRLAGNGEACSQTGRNQSAARTAQQLQINGSGRKNRTVPPIRRAHGFQSFHPCKPRFSSHVSVTVPGAAPGGS